jgi:hypothetical protein
MKKAILAVILLAVIAALLLTACESKEQKVVKALEGNDIPALTAIMQSANTNLIQTAAYRSLENKDVDIAVFTVILQYANPAVAQTTALKALELERWDAYTLSFDAAGPGFLETLVQDHPSPGGDFKYELTKDGTGIRLLEYTGNNPILVIPSSIEGYPVKIINGSFSKCRLKTVVIPEGVEEIYAFQFQNRLSRVVLPDSLQIIDGAFQDCSSLTEVNIPDSVHTIGWYSFAGCSNLAEINIPAGIKQIGRFAFIDCGELYNLHIPDSITKIDFVGFYAYLDLAESQAFRNQFIGCTKLPLATRQRLVDLGYVSEGKPGYF